jgi:hypothetical protein
LHRETVALLMADDFTHFGVVHEMP